MPVKAEAVKKQEAVSKYTMCIDTVSSFIRDKYAAFYPSMLGDL